MENKPYCYKYPHPAITTDSVIFGFDGKQLHLLLIERGLDPYKGCWAFPGGFLNMDETVEEGAHRELYEETGVKDVYMEQLQVFSDVHRDPRERVITVAFYALVNTTDYQIIGGDDAARAKWFPIDVIPALAFDHEQILRVAQIRLRQKVHFEPVCFKLLGEVFTMSALQTLYETILDVKFDRRNFAKKMLSLHILTAQPRDPHVASRVPVKYTFNETAYCALRSNGFRLEF